MEAKKARCIYLYVPYGFRDWFWNLVIAVSSISCGLITLLTLGFVNCDWVMYAEGKYLDVVEDIQYKQQRKKMEGY